jgi:hypothetical protein
MSDAREKPEDQSLNARSSIYIQFENVREGFMRCKVVGKVCIG